MTSYKTFQLLYHFPFTHSHYVFNNSSAAKNLFGKLSFHMRLCKSVFHLCCCARFSNSQVKKCACLWWKPKTISKGKAKTLRLLLLFRVLFLPQVNITNICDFVQRWSFISWPCRAKMIKGKKIYITSKAAQNVILWRYTHLLACQMPLVISFMPPSYHPTHKSLPYLKIKVNCILKKELIQKHT